MNMKKLIAMVILQTPIFGRWTNWATASTIAPLAQLKLKPCNMVPTPNIADKERRHEAHRKYYAQLIIIINSRLANETPEAREQHLIRHCRTQAEYRMANRMQLKLKSWQDRKEKKWRQCQEQDERKYVALMEQIGEIEPPVV
ncbi:hypothetical protein CPB84DRAFT_1743225 [Gymnopilus junonius]|uniref:Secreted protein n=1 Tax=Gymnopilus junonius TaxID=109634 RepID=A0A9P5NYU3_GYMJU|nr:hypothetical protein CPB84DRAFT_1743225 [Gymnopilus junonius]